MRTHAVPEVDCLEFIDEYPRVTTRLTRPGAPFPDPAELRAHLLSQLKCRSDSRSGAQGGGGTGGS